MPGGGLIIPGTYRRGWKVEDLPTSSGPITPLTEEEADLLLGRTPANQEGLTAAVGNAGRSSLDPRGCGAEPGKRSAQAIPSHGR